MQEKTKRCIECGEELTKGESFFEEGGEIFHPDCAGVYRCRECGEWNEEEEPFCVTCGEWKP